MKIVTKPWGKEEWLELNEKYCYKRIYINKGYKTSYQYHNFKRETNYIISGEAEVWLENDTGEVEKLKMKAGEYFNVTPPKKHRVIALTDIILQEVSTPEVDDVIRIEDDTNRKDGKIDSEHHSIEQKDENPLLFILAAGKGTRLKSFTDNKNKALLPINNKAVISHIIDKFPESTDIVIAVGSNKESLIDYCELTYPTRNITIELDAIYEHRKHELETLIRTNFVCPIELSWTRNYTQSDWIETYDHLDNRLIWFYCNHDHIFYDSSITYLEKVVEKLRNEEELCSFAFSHWPECVRTAKLSKDYKLEDVYMSVRNTSFDSIQIITKELYKEWWCTGNFNQYKLPRPDFFGIGLAEIKPVPIHKTIYPYKEVCRHFDGYQHCNPPILNDKCPAINIPPGIFTNDIKISYKQSYNENCVNIDPQNEHYHAVNLNGIDLKTTLYDVPLVISKRSKFEKITPDELDIQYRLKDILNMIYYNGFPIDSELESTILSEYLIPYENLL